LTRLADFDYELPRELIAQTPVAERDRSRLLYLSPDRSLGHHVFRDLAGLLHPGDLLVLNDTRVFPARLQGVRAGGGRSELLLLERLDSDLWRVLAKPARKLPKGARLSFGGGKLEAEVLEVEEDGKRIAGFRFEGDWEALLQELGTTPLPPYIAYGASPEDEPATRLRYQTIYARPSGSIAAPTAGLHFTETMFEALRARGVDVAFITLHVGHATFQPIREGEVEAHRMGVERYLVPEETKEKIRLAEKRVVAVGTTTVRALESAALAAFPPGFRETDLFITPGFEFRVVTGLLTNFHLPKSSLLILVSAFGGRERVLEAYREAVKERYRFYSFGDAMLLYPPGVP
jgi:S-adenosylmethionine:tRNA ribosyltransferase-isomerase